MRPLHTAFHRAHPRPVLNSLIGVALSLAAAAASAQTLYTVTNIGTLGGTGITLAGINNLGLVAGSSSTATGHLRPFLYQGGVMSTFPIPTSPTWGATGMAVNDAGQMTGHIQNAANAYRDKAYSYSGGVATELGNFGYTGDVYSRGEAINNAGTIAGIVGLNNSVVRRGFVQPAGAGAGFVLGTLGGSSSYATGINDAGRVVGYSDLTGDTSSNAFAYSAGVMTNLGTLGGAGSLARAINNNGQIVGWSTTASNATHAFSYSTGVMRDLGTLGGQFSYARGLNNLGDVAGQSTLAGDTLEAGFVLRNGSMLNLNGLLDPTTGAGWNVINAIDINDSGWIVAYGTRAGSFQQFGLLLSPVPEPSSALLMLLGLGLAGGAVRRQRKAQGHGHQDRQRLNA